MILGDDPWAPAPDGGDPFASADTGPPISYGTPRREDSHRDRGKQAPLNTFAVLAPIFAILFPPAGVAFGHLALPQIRRTGQRGWLAAVWGLAIGYLMTLVLLSLLIWLTTGAGRSHIPADASPSQQAAPPPSVATSVAPAPRRPHTKLELSQAAVGQCVEVQKRDQGGDEALDLYLVECQHRVGVYQVAARVSGAEECNSTYVASPPDRSFAVCLNRY